MNNIDIIGSLGVGILLIAFVLSLLGKLNKDGYTYLALNTIGASLACLASILLKYWPFIILEACWVMASFFALIKLFAKKSD